MRGHKINVAVFSVLMVVFFGLNDYMDRRQENRLPIEGDTIFPGFNPDTVRRITITRPASLSENNTKQTIELVRSTQNLDKWSMASPYQGDVYSFLTTTFLGHIETARIKKIVTFPDADEQKKIDMSSVDVRITLADAPQIRFMLSNRTSGSREYLYMKLPNEARYYLVPTNPFGSFMSEARDYLTPKMFMEDIENVDSVRIISVGDTDALPTMGISIFREKNPQDATTRWFLVNFSGNTLQPKTPAPIHPKRVQQFIKGELLQRMLLSRRFSEKPNPWELPKQTTGVSKEPPAPPYFVDIAVNPPGLNAVPTRYFLRFPNDDPSAKIMLVVRLLSPKPPAGKEKIDLPSTVMARLRYSGLEVMEIPTARVKRLLQKAAELTMQATRGNTADSNPSNTGGTGKE